jgi:ribosomal protein L24
MKRIQKIFQVEDKKISTGSFRFCGREISQAEDFAITATCKDTTEKLEKIKYRTQVKKDSPVNEGEKAQLRSVVGSLAWIARQARPDLSYKVSKLQSKCNRATIKDLIYANQAIDEAREHSNQGIIYKSDAINLKNCSIVTVSDASWSNEDEQVKKKVQKYRSQRARMTILVNPDFLKKEESAFHVISWQSTIIRRICRNTLQAETYGVNFAIEEGMRLRALIAETHGELQSLKDWETKSRSFRQHIWITDCKSLEEHLKSDTMGKVDDKRLSIDIQTLRQLIWEDANEEEQDELRDDMPDVIQWIDTSKMLVDALTKDMKSSELRRTLETGVWNTVPSPEAQLIKLMKPKYRRERRIREAEELAVPQDQNHG